MELGWKTIEELIGNESKTMVLKSFNDLASQCMCNLFTRNLAWSSRNLWNTETDLKGIDIVKSWPGPGQNYNLLYSTASTHPVSLCS